MEAFDTRGVLKQHRYMLEVATLVILSNLLWYRFSHPPVTANSGFDIFPLRTIVNSIYPFNFFSWPVSYIPPIFGIPNDLIYFVPYALSGNSYGVAIFVVNTIYEILGASSLFYLISQFLKGRHMDERYAFIGVIFFLFNEGAVEGASFETGASLFITAFVLLYLSYTRGPRYSILFGVFSFFLLSGFPNGTLTYTEEAVASALVIFFYLYVTNRRIFSVKGFIKTTLYLIIFTIIANIYMIWPSLIVYHEILSALTSSAPNYAFSFSFDTHETLLNAIRLVDNWAEFSGFAPLWFAGYFASWWVQALLYLPFFMSAVAVLFSRSKRMGDWFIFSLLVLLTFLSKANNPPFGWIFGLLVSKIALFRPFYNGASFSPFLIFAYAILISYFAAQIQWHIGRSRKLGSIKSIAKPVIPILIAALLIAPVYPLLSPQVTEGNPTTPLTSTLPQYYYEASDFLSRSTYSPVMVFPSVPTFNSNKANGTVWYNGINIYSGIILNPSVSGIFPLNYEGGKGQNTYTILATVYSLNRPIPPTDPINTKWLLQGNGNNNSALPSIIFSPHYEYDKSSLSPTGSMVYTVNESMTPPGGQMLIGRISPPLNLSAYTFLYLVYNLDNVNASDVQLGLFNPSGDGNWYWISSFPTVHNGINTTAMISLRNPSIYGGGNLSTVSAIVVNYVLNSPKDEIGRIKLINLGITKSESPAPLIAQDMATLGIQYAYVDTSIMAGNGTYYNYVLSSNPYFTKVFSQGTVTIYRNNLYTGLFGYTTSVMGYSNLSTLIYNLYHRNASGDTALVDSLNYPGLVDSTFDPLTILNYTSNSYTYNVNVEHNGTSLLIFRTDYNKNWIALGGGHELEHVEVDGYANAWIVPRGTDKITITFNNEEYYAVVEIVGLTMPMLLGLLYLVFWAEKLHIA